jgi:hypothetical protein
MNTAEFKSDTKGIFDFDLVGTQYNFLRDYTNTYSQYGAVPTAVNTAGVPTAWNVNPTGSNVNQGATTGAPSMRASSIARISISSASTSSRSA